MLVRLLGLVSGLARQSELVDDVVAPIMLQGVLVRRRSRLGRLDRLNALEERRRGLLERRGPPRRPLLAPLRGHSRRHRLLAVRVTAQPAAAPSENVLLLLSQHPC